EEWLFTWPNGRKAMWLERERDRFEFGKTLRGENEAIQNLTRPNSLFLSAAAQNNHPLLLPLARHFISWQFSLARRQDWFSQQSIIQRLSTDSDGAQRASIVQLLKDADTGILDIRVDSAGDLASTEVSVASGLPNAVSSSSGKDLKE